jgi:hypothetical protein
MLFSFVHFSPQRVNGTEYQVRWSNSAAEQTVEILIFPPGSQVPQTAIRLASAPFMSQGAIAAHPPQDLVLDFPCTDPPVKAVAVNAHRAAIRLDDGSLIRLERVN